MKDEEIRKAFEWWASDEGEWPKAVERSRDGAYKLMSTDANWRVWQAATRAAVPDGWKAVPLEPTPAMITDAHAIIGSCMGSCGEAIPPDASDIAYALRCAIADAPEVKP